MTERTGENKVGFNIRMAVNEGLQAFNAIGGKDLYHMFIRGAGSRALLGAGIGAVVNPTITAMGGGEVTPGSFIRGALLGGTVGALSGGISAARQVIDPLIGKYTLEEGAELAEAQLRAFSRAANNPRQYERLKRIFGAIYNDEGAKNLIKRLSTEYADEWGKIQQTLAKAQEAARKAATS